MLLTERERDFIKWYRRLPNMEQIAVRCYLRSGDERLLVWFGEGRETLHRLVGAPLPERDDERALIIT